MNLWNPPFVLICTLFAFAFPVVAAGQSAPTASRAFVPSAFAGVTGTYTGLELSRNLAITAGADIGFRPFFGLLPSVEVRGTYPLDSGQLVGEKSFMGGLRVQKRFNHVRPYADILYGRGALDYQGGGFVVPSQNFRYIESTSNVLSLGIGVEIDTSDRFALLLDGQYQRWDIPFSTGADPATPGNLHSKVGTIGVVYRFGWLLHGHPAP